MRESRIIGGIEMGSSKAMVIIGEVEEGRSLNIVGVGECEMEGMRKGEIYDFKAASECVHEAILRAEKSGGVSIENVYLAQTGGHIQSFYNTGTVNVLSSDNIVMEEDIERGMQEAKSKQISKDRVYLHHIQNGFYLDGRRVINPLGMEGQKLTVAYLSVHGDLSKVRDAIHVINGFGLNVEDMIVSGLASSVMAVGEHEKNNGVLVLDIGAGTTDYLLYRDGYIYKTGVVPVGGTHITNDLSLGLKLSQQEAEEIKKQYGCYQNHMIHSDLMTTHGKEDTIYQIIQLRVQELLDIILKILNEDLNMQQVPCGVVLTGGTSQLNGLLTIVSETLNIDARNILYPEWVIKELKKPEASTVLGLLSYAVMGGGKGRGRPLLNSSNILKKVAKIFHF